jgi:hypothetical protein
LLDNFEDIHFPPQYLGETRGAFAGAFAFGIGTPDEMSLQASVMHLPTLIEGFRTIDGRAGDISTSSQEIDVKGVLTPSLFFLLHHRRLHQDL